MEHPARGVSRRRDGHSRNQRYQIADRELQRASLEHVQAGIKECNAAIVSLRIRAPGGRAPVTL
jgi:hypothetical protein